MSCVINAGYTIDCNKDSLGGLADVYLAPLKDVEAFTEDVSGVVTSINMVTGKQFFKFALVKSSSSFQTVPTTNTQNGVGFYNETLTLVFNKMKPATSKLVDAIVKSSLIAIAVDRNGEAVILGRENGLDVTGGNAGSGVAAGDRNGYELSLTGEEGKISHIDPAAIAALLIPAV
jgi:hypothetical protein